MPEPFKNFFNPQMIAQMGHHLKNANAEFDAAKFQNLATRNFDALELKQRSTQITQALTATLPPDFRSASQIMQQALHPVDDADLGDMGMDDRGIRGWPIMPMADYVAEQGMDDFDFSMDMLAEFTKRFSSEFAVRHFFIDDQERALKKAMQWTGHENHHVRRLASEGSRPRLPWGIQLTSLVKDPTPLLPLLEKLQDDDHEYVRRSVANNINDIAKDHPDVVAKLAGRWLKNANQNKTRMVKHACRTLIKKGHKPTLAALGYGKPDVDLTEFQIHTPEVALGKHLEFSVTLMSRSKTSQPLILDFNIHHQMANGKLSPKTFKWKILDLPAGQSVTVSKRHAIKPITTRKYYVGTHKLEIQVNGEIMAQKEFKLVV